MHDPENTIASIRDWFETAKPNETLTVKDVQVQTGVHFEEVHEMLQEISGLTPETDLLLAKAKLAMHALADHFKTSPDVIFVIDEANHVPYLDALCDQVVTAVGTAHFMQYGISGALDTVAKSNWSKFIVNPETGKRECIKDANGKIAKGPDYFKADLTPYI
ncbi:hypothetical protein [Aquabacterium sp.]|uniref:hypothetical protein n=1 Tax=Aquabacterium sp. TaxID=1872578 RepID=UPI0025C03433|nr:hypothetical protein [Aquabacterium sp.]